MPSVAETLQAHASVVCLQDPSLTGLTTLSSLGLSFFSTRWPLSLPSPFSSLQNFVNLCVFQMMENTWGTGYWLDLSLCFSFPSFILLATSVYFLPLLFPV